MKPDTSHERPHAGAASQAGAATPAPARKLARIVVIGGGAGGLELVTRLGNVLGRRGRAQIVLVDKSPSHLWKPLLHEVAAGSMDANTHQLDYLAQARWHRFEFQQGELVGLDRVNKTIEVDAVRDEDGLEVLPRRVLAYDTLVLAIGSVTNFFGVPGAQELALAVDTVAQAERFRHKLIGACMRAENGIDDVEEGKRQVDIAIIGGGATGVELSAELRNTAQVLGAYGLHRLDPRRDVRITLIEGGPRILPPLPERIASETATLLGGLNVQILTGERVVQVQKHAVLTESGKRIAADITVWAGGIRVPKILEDLGLPVNKLGQVIVSQTLQSIIDADIFAMGDCASCPWPGHAQPVPPRAQAAHQQADYLADALARRLGGRALPAFNFRDHGSLISLSRYDVVGNLIGQLTGRSIRVEGRLARLLYVSLYRQHLMALHGFTGMLLDWVGQWLRRRTTPRVKLH
ncbi:MAG: ndh [Paucimonas sp.]|nr:ndh [Paucimonas sp.]